MSTSDITHVLAWHCLVQRHGVAIHAAIIVLDDLLLDCFLKQIQLSTFKIEILPLLFAGAVAFTCVNSRCRGSTSPVLLRSFHCARCRHRAPMQAPVHCTGSSRTISAVLIRQ